MKPIDLAIDETAIFILDHIHAAHARILDVGCGDGMLSSRLLARGHKVVAIEESAEMVQQARARGIDARLASWPSFEDRPFDVLVFARSLHHLSPLSEAVEQANRLLAPKGQVIVEDFAWAEIDPITAEWFYGIVRLLASCGVLIPSDDSFVIELAQSGGEFSFWEQSHDHDLLTVSEMWSALRTHFQSLFETSTPYLYRYLCPVLAKDEVGYSIASQVLELEKRMERIGVIKPIGRRFVGIKV